jgi:O-antigen ligase
VIFILSVPFSYVYSLDFLETNKSFTSFAFYAIYLIDLTAIFLLAVTLINPYWHKKSILTPWLAFPLFAFLSFLWSGSPFLSAFWGLRLVLIVTALSIVIKLIRKEKYYSDLFYKILIASGVIESLIAIGQFIFQRSLGLYLLGESHLGPEVLGLTRVSLLGHDLLRAYGTLPHPNILGGFLLFTLVVTARAKTFKNEKLLLLVQLVGLGLTFSRSAILGLIIIIFLNRELLSTYIPRFGWKKQRKAFAVIFLFLFIIILARSPIQNILSGRDPATRLRVEYAQAAWQRFADSPIFGRGWGTGPIELPAYSHYPFYSWELQPVHNIFLLVLSDLGLVGLIIFLYFIYRVLKRSRNIWQSLFIAYLFIGLFDHYFLTLPQGIFIFFAAALFAAEREKNREKTPRLAKSNRTSLPFG